MNGSTENQSQNHNLRDTQKAKTDDSEPKSVYSEEEEQDSEIEEDGIIQDELGL